MEDQNVLTVKDLRTVLDLSNGSIPVVDGISFSVRAGETLGIVGESGSGKSMTAFSLMQVLPKPIGRIDGGEIWLDGENLVGKSESEMNALRGKKIGMILQDPHTSLNPVYTIGNQVTEALRINLGITGRRSLLDRAIAALKSVNVADAERRVDAYPHQMSGGMKQRVVGAIAISGEPKVIIADEPTTALDVTIQLQYLNLLKSIQKETGLAIVFITHDLGIVANLCHQIVVMYAGKIVEAGSVADVLNAPSHPYTEALLKSVPSVDQKSDRLYAISGQPPSPFDENSGCSFAPRCPYATDRCRTEVPQERPGLTNSPTHRASCWNMERNT